MTTVFLPPVSVAGAVGGAPVDLTVPDPNNAQGLGWGTVRVVSLAFEATAGTGVLSVIPVWDGASDSWVDQSATPPDAKVSEVRVTLNAGEPVVLSLLNPGARQLLALRCEVVSGDLSAVLVTAAGVS